MSDNYWNRTLRRSVSRRRVLRGAGVGSVGLAGAALIGCGPDEDEPATPSPAAGTPTGATGTPAAGGTAAATGTATDEFGHVKRGGVWKESDTGDPPTLDPYGNLSFLTKGFAAHPYSRLYKIGARPDLNPNSALPEPDLAESAETEDGQTWVVKLRQGAKFHNVAPLNGREATTEDVLFSWERLTAEDSPNASMVENFVNVEAVDEHTLRFELAGPTATFLDTLADANILWIMPPESDGGFDPTQAAIGTGPWILEEYRPSVGFRYSKHPEWFIEGKPFMDGAEIAIIPEYANGIAQFEAGNLHRVGVRADDVLRMRDDNTDVQWRGLQPALLSFIYFSPEAQEPDAPWRDERFRHAVSMATDRDALTELGYNVAALRDAGLDVISTWSNLVPAGFTRWWLDPQSGDQGPSAQYFEYNPDEARKLIEAVGADGATFKYQYTANRYGSTFNSIAEAIGNYLLEVGLNAETEVQDYSSQYITQTFVGNFTGVAFGYETPFPEVGGYFPRMFGDDPANHSKIQDPEISDLAQKQAVELDEEQRREYIWEIQRVNDTHMYYIPNQAGAGTGWTAYHPQLRGILQTRSYGEGTEVLPNLWLDA